MKLLNEHTTDGSVQWELRDGDLLLVKGDE